MSGKQSSQPNSLLPTWLLLVLTTPILAIIMIVETVEISALVDNAAGLAFFFVLLTAGEVLYVPLPKGGGVSVGLAIVLACAAVYGPGPAALISGIAIVTAIAIISPNVGWVKYVGNFSQAAISAFAAGWVFQVVGGRLEGGGLVQNAFSFFMASTAFFVVNVSLFVAFLSSLNRQPFRTFWPDIKNILISYFALVPLGILVALIFKNYGIFGSLLFFVPLLLARYSFLQYLNTRKAGLTVTQVLAAALEAKDAYTRGHSDRVAKLAEKVARELNLPEENTEIIKYAAEMHDIGKIGISENLLNKPDMLNDAELAEVRKHAVIGAEMLEKIEFLRGVADIIKYHHEWFDGSRGYPRERAGKNIPLGARILMVCDAYDAMTSDRPYRKSLDKEAAIRELREGAGSQFDPSVVEAFLRVLSARASEHPPNGE
ncbi:MAG: HD-GYP domain-containing protein [Bacillota bacterium]|nr:HD-GYP domain-containing protein [Bacillota bacterium]